jgi:hypothetical protein
MQGVGFVYRDKFENLVTFNPSFDVFVGSVVTLGGGLLISHSKFANGGGSYTNAGASFRFGINANLGPRVSIWPLLVNSGVYGSNHSSYGSTSLSLPLLIHIVPHFFFGVGPVVAAQRYTDTDLYGTSLQWSEELDTFIGGWW